MQNNEQEREKEKWEKGEERGRGEGVKCRAQLILQDLAGET